jgi:hypothetical protein
MQCSPHLAWRFQAGARAASRRPVGKRSTCELATDVDRPGGGVVAARHADHDLGTHGGLELCIDGPRVMAQFGVPTCRCRFPAVDRDLVGGWRRDDLGRIRKAALRRLALVREIEFLSEFRSDQLGTGRKGCVPHGARGATAR